jgi:hypothetical protein
MTTRTKRTRALELLHAWPALLVLLAACFCLASPDVPLGMAWGRAIVQRGALPDTNVFSHMNPDRVVLLDKWLFQVAIYWVHSHTGPPGLILFRVALLLVALGAGARAAGIRWRRPSHALAAVGMALALLNRCYVRAELVTWAALPLMLCLVPGIAAGRKRTWVWLVLVQAIWANAHGYWVVGPMLWAAIAAGALVQPWLVRMGIGLREAVRQRGALSRLIAAVPVSLVASCLTPYGVKTLAHPVRLAMELRSHDILKRAVDDFGSPLEAIQRGGTIPFWACCAMGLGGILAAVYLVRRRRVRGELLAVLALGLVLGLAYYRNMTMLALCALPMIVVGIEERWAAARGASWHYALAGLPAVLWLAAAFGGVPQATDYGARQPGFGWQTSCYPIGAAEWIARNVPDQTLWNDFGSGGWLNLRLGEGKTYIDGNTDGYPLEFLEQYDAKFNGANVQPWISAETGCTVAMIDYGDSEDTVAKFLRGVSWFDAPSFGYVDERYCVLLPSPDAPGADARLTASFWRGISASVNASPELKAGHDLDVLTAVPASAPDEMYARSGRLAIWLYPDDPAAQAHYARTQDRR